MPTRFNYLRQDSPLTLAEGLEEYSASYPFLNTNDGSTEASTWFRQAFEEVLDTLQSSITRRAMCGLLSTAMITAVLDRLKHWIGWKTC